MFRVYVWGSSSGIVVMERRFIPSDRTLVEQSRIGPQSHQLGKTLPVFIEYCAHVRGIIMKHEWEGSIDGTLCLADYYSSTCRLS